MGPTADTNPPSSKLTDGVPTPSESFEPFSHDEIFRVMMVESPLPVSVQDDQWRFVFVNQAYCRYTGYTAAELIGKDPAGWLFPPEDGAGLLDMRHSAERASTDRLPIYPPVRELVRKDGQRVRFHVDLSVSRTRRGATLWCGVVFDLMHLEQTQAKLNEAEQASQEMRFRFDSFAALSNEAMIVADLESNRILHANRVVWDCLGVTEPDLANAPVSTLWQHVSLADLPAINKACDFLASNRTHEFTITLNHPENGPRKLRIRLFRNDRPGAEIYILADDMTEQLREAEQRLQQAVFRRDALVKEVYHRIKNNLQGVIGVLQSARIEGDSARQAINEAIHKINAIAEVNGMLTSGPSQVAINDLISRLGDYLASAFNASVTVHYQVSDAALPPPTINYDAVPIALVMNEIITNAIKYHKGPKPVSVQIEHDRLACAVHVMNRGSLARDDVFESIAPNTHGLGLVKALLPTGSSYFRLHQQGETVCASLWLDANLIGRPESDT